MNNAIQILKIKTHSKSDSRCNNFDYTCSEILKQ